MKIAESKGTQKKYQKNGDYFREKFENIQYNEILDETEE